MNRKQTQYLNANCKQTQFLNANCKQTAVNRSKLQGDYMGGLA